MTTRPSSSDVSMFLISSKYGLKPKGDYDQPGVNPALAATKSLSKYGLKPKGDYDTPLGNRASPHLPAHVQIRTEAERRL